MLLDRSIGYSILIHVDSALGVKSDHDSAKGRVGALFSLQAGECLLVDDPKLDLA
jgi:hypothetical protein